MTIILTPEIQARIQEKAQQEGTDFNAVVNNLLLSALDWEGFDKEETIKGIQRGLDDSDVGRVRPFSEFAAEMRTKYRLPVHLSDEAIGITK